MALEEQGIELIDESEAEDAPRPAQRRLQRRTPSAADEEPDARPRSRIEERRQLHRRPGAHVPDADGRDPAAHARARKSRWPRRSKSPASASAARCSSCDYALRQRVETLKQVHSGELPFDRTIKVSLTENLEKDKILQRMPHNLRTLEHLMEQNREDFDRLIDKRRRRRSEQRRPQAVPASAAARP